MGLNNQRRGYAVMSKDLDAIRFDAETIEECSRYIADGYVIAERIPYVYGFSIRVTWYKWWKCFYFKYMPYNILWLHFSWNKEFTHKTGNIVYTPNQQEEQK